MPEYIQLDNLDNVKAVVQTPAPIQETPTVILRPPGDYQPELVKQKLQNGVLVPR